MAIKDVSSMAEFRSELQSAGDKLVVVDFFAEWCGPCNQMAPFFARMARRFTHAVFLKVNISNLPAIAESEGVSSLPTFAFYIRSRKVDFVQGANRDELERKIVAYVKDFDEEVEACVVPGQEDLMMYVNPKDCECLNERDDHPFSHCLSKGEAWLESDCDEQLLIFIKFQEMAKLHSFRMKGKDGMGPKTVKVFINLPHCLDFDRAMKLEPVESFVLTEKQAADGEVIQVHCVKYQSVHSLQFFVVNNQANSETTRIMELGMYGTPADIMRMDDFKRHNERVLLREEASRIQDKAVGRSEGALYCILYSSPFSTKKQFLKLAGRSWSSQTRTVVLEPTNRIIYMNKLKKPVGY